MGDQSSSIGALIVVLVTFALPIALKLCGIGAKRITMKNPATGQIRDGFYGYSWTYLLFGWFVPLFRGELGVAALHLLFSIITLGIWQVIVSFLYNEQYTQRLISSGYKFADSDLKNIEAAKKISIDLALHLPTA